MSPASRGLLCFFCAAALPLLPARTPAQPATHPIVLRAARLIAANDDKVVNNAAVIIEGEKIAAVGSGIAVPPDAEVIDLGDSTLLPGLIDAHTHLLLEMDGPSVLQQDIGMLKAVATQTTAERALLGARNAKEELDAGITTVRDLGNSGVDGDIALRNAIQRGWVAGPRILAATRAFAAPGGQFGALTPEAQKIIGEEYVILNGANSARQAVRQALYEGANCIKVIVNGSPADVTPEEMTAIVQEAHAEGVKVAAHAIGDKPTRIAAQAGVDSIEHAYVVSDDVLQMMAHKHIFLVPTDVTQKEVEAMVYGSRQPSPTPGRCAPGNDGCFSSRIGPREKNVATFRCPSSPSSSCSRTLFPNLVPKLDPELRQGDPPMDVQSAINAGLFVEFVYENWNSQSAQTNLNGKAVLTAQQKPIIPGKGYTVVKTIYANDLATGFTPDRSNGFVTMGIVAVNDADATDVFIAIRGTEGVWEWLQDAKFLARPFQNVQGSGLTEDGFTDMYQSFSFALAQSKTFMADLAASIDPNARVTISGHSLGSALATLLALDMAVNTKFKIKIYTLASPRVGDLTFHNLFNHVVQDAFRVDNRMDIVPKVPPPLFYFHVGDETELVPPPNLKFDLACEHSILSYFNMLGALIGRQADYPIDAKCLTA